MSSAVWVGPSLISLMVSVDVKHHVYVWVVSEFRNGVKVEAAVLGFPS